jgi:peptidyl-prolyl cis-trans isomerase D
MPIQYRQPKQVKARHILFKVDEDASGRSEERALKRGPRKYLEKARKGEDFAALAKEYSEGPSKSQGGDLGYFKAGQMEPPFEKAAFALKKGEISDPGENPFWLSHYYGGRHQGSRHDPTGTGATGYSGHLDRQHYH